MNIEQITARIPLIVAAMALVVVSGCAGSGVKKADVAAAVTQAQEAIERAQQGDARNYAPVALNSAQIKLQNAKSALQAGSNKSAKYLAEEVAVDAEYALAKAKTGRSEEAEKQLEQSLKVMQQSMNKSNGNQ